MEKLTRWYYLEMRWARCGLTREDVRAYVQHHFKAVFYVKDEEMMNNAMGAIVDIEDKTARLLLTPEQFEDVIENTELSPASHYDFMSNLEAAVFKATGVRTEKAWTKKHELLEADLADATGLPQLGGGGMPSGGRPRKSLAASLCGPGRLQLVFSPQVRGWGVPKIEDETI